MTNSALCYAKIAKLTLWGYIRISHFVTHFLLPVFYLKSQRSCLRKSTVRTRCAKGIIAENFCLPTAPFACSANRIREPHRFGRCWSNARIFSAFVFPVGERTERYSGSTVEYLNATRLVIVFLTLFKIRI